MFGNGRHVSPPFPKKHTTVQCCSCHLQCSELEEGPMVQSLCAMMLLEGCSPRQAFAKFLVARKAAIQSVFRAAVLGEGPHRSVKSQVCQVTRSLLHSLLHISAIFCQQRMPDGSLGTWYIQSHDIPYRKSGFNNYCEYLLKANCEVFKTYNCIAHVPL